MTAFTLAVAANVWQILYATGILLVLLVVGFLLVSWVRKKARGDDAALGGPVFSLSQLRRMKRDGEISDEEYEKLRAGIIGSLGSDSADKPRPTPNKSIADSEDADRP